MYLSNAYIRVYMTSVYIESATATSSSGATTYGGAFYISAADTLSIKSSTLSNMYAGYGAVMYSTATTLKLTLSSNTITCNTTYSVSDARE